MMSVLNSNCTVCHSQLQRSITLLCEFLDNYSWLSSAYLSDYFTRSLWTEVNESWWQTICEQSPPQLATLLSASYWNSNKVWPLSLLAHRAVTQLLALTRHSHPLTSHHLESLASSVCKRHEASKEETNANSEKYRDTKEACKIINGQHMLLDHSFRKHVKPKKQHEILQLSEIISKVANCQNCSKVVDVGAGQGHLSRLLHFGYGLQATTVEATGCHAPKARKYDDETQSHIMKAVLHKKKRRQASELMPTLEPAISPAEKPKHVIGWIKSTSTSEEFLEQIKMGQSYNRLKTKKSDESLNRDNCTSVQTSAFNEDDAQGVCHYRHGETKKNGKEDESNFKFLITGLHACGDLSTTLLRVFTNCKQACGLVSVACCYMKLTTDSQDPEENCYPMSKFLKNRMQHSLSWEAREMACHFVDQYCTRLQENPESLRSHVYRAALQEIIHSKCPEIEHGSVRLTLKKTHELPFVEYAGKALTRLQLDPNVTAEQLEKAEERLQHSKQVIAYYTLRLSLAPALEHLILLDRLCYLAECGINSLLLPVFDPRLSPRSNAIVAVKPSSDV